MSSKLAHQGKKNLISKKMMRYLGLFFLIDIIIYGISIIGLTIMKSLLSSEMFIVYDTLMMLILLLAAIIEIVLTAHLSVKEAFAVKPSIDQDQPASNQEKVKVPSTELFSEFINRTENLTYTERLIFNHYLEGKSGAEVTQLMGITLNTLKVHNNHIYKKLQVSSKEELFLYVELIRKSGMLSEIVK